MVGAHARRRSGRAGAGFILRMAFAAVLFIAGLGLLLAPVGSAVVAQTEVDAAFAGWSDRIASEAAGEQDETYECLLEYNEEVRGGVAHAINDPFAWSGDSLSELGIPDGIVGEVDVPVMGVSLPLYLGATPENLDKGACVVAGTSMPTGGEGTNTVVAAHRGAVLGLPMFRDIEKLSAGDLVTVRTPWDTLDYRVREITVIDPDDVDAVKVQPGRDLLTLLTCHPYGQNSHRYLVVCERADEASDASTEVTVADYVRAALVPSFSQDSWLLGLEGCLRILGLVFALAAGCVLVYDAVRRG